MVRISSTAKGLLDTIRTKAEKRKPNGATALQDYLARKAAQADAPEGGR